METATWTTQRQATADKRKRPRPQQWIRYAADSKGEHGPADTPPPTELFIEATRADGEIAPWFDDWWWMEGLARWKDNVLTAHILPSPAALLHPVVLHHVEMVRRVARLWRVVGHVPLDELDLDVSPEALARSSYHEIRVIDSPAPDSVRRNPKRPPKLQDIFGGIRRVQRELGTTLPVLVRASEAPDADYQ